MQNLNYYRWMCGLIGDVNKGAYKNLSGAEIGMNQNYVKTYGTPMSNNISSDPRMYGSGQRDYTIFYGFGNGVSGTPADGTTDKWNLDSHIESNLTLNSISTTLASNESPLFFTHTVSITNKSASAVDICEIGIFISSSQTFDVDNTALLMREVIDTVTLQPNETRSFTINFM